MNTFISCGLPWFPWPTDGKCPCGPDQRVRFLWESEKSGDSGYINAVMTASGIEWDVYNCAGWFPVNPDGTEITPSLRPARPRVLRRRFPLARGVRPTWK